MLNMQTLQSPYATLKNATNNLWVKTSSSIPANNPLAQHRLLVDERHPPPNHPVAPNAEIQSLVQIESIPLVRRLRHREAMQDR